VILVPVAALALVLGQEPGSVAPAPAAGAETFYQPGEELSSGRQMEERTEQERPNGGHRYTVTSAWCAYAIKTLNKTARWWARADP